jgi:hypothetical protein
VTRRIIPRRTVLRGTGVALALPFLDAMRPYGQSVSSPPSSIRRLATFYVPNGMAMADWTPAHEGRDFALTPILEPLAPFRKQLRVISGLSTLDLPVVPAYHAAASTKFLTGTTPDGTRGSIAHAGVSMDQVAARTLGGDTLIPSLEVGLEATELVGACDVQYSCAYQNTICWSARGEPLPMESNPRAVFERLFGDVDLANSAARARDRLTDRSVLDSIAASLVQLERAVGARDRARLEQYVEAVRDVERHLHRAERIADDTPDVTVLTAPPGTYVERYTLLLDLMALAFHADLTHVCTLMVGREASMQTYPHLGISEAHHQISHHQNDPSKVAKLAAINTQHTQVLAYFLDRLRAIEDGNGSSLLDTTLVLYGAGMSDSNLHRHDNLPVLVAGGRPLADGTHVRYELHTPLANLHITILSALGLPVQRFGNSTGSL